MQFCYQIEREIEDEVTERVLIYHEAKKHCIKAEITILEMRERNIPKSGIANYMNY